MPVGAVAGSRGDLHHRRQFWGIGKPFGQRACKGPTMFSSGEWNQISLAASYKQILVQLQD